LYQSSFAVNLTCKSMKKLLLPLLLLLGLVFNASAAITASGIISWTQTGSTFNYSIKLSNTGTTHISTFWFAWIPGQDYIPNTPTPTSPAGWSATVTNGGAADGFGIMWTTSSAPVPAGGTVTGFNFSSTSTPAQIMGDSTFHPGHPVTTSFVYIEGAFQDAGFQFVVTTPPTLSVSHLALAAPAVVGGASVGATVTLSGPAPAEGASAALGSDNTALATTPPSLAFTSGQTSQVFPVTTKGVDSAATVHVHATLNGTQSAALILNPAVLSSVKAPASCIGGNNFNATIFLNGKAGPSGKTISLASNSSTVTVPASVAVLAQTSSRTVAATTQGVDAEVVVTLTATVNATTRTAAVHILPANLARVSFAAPFIYGGNPVAAAGVLNGKAGPSGVPMTFSSNSAAATVPAGGSATAQTVFGRFQVTTHPVLANTTVTISATAKGITKTAALVIRVNTLSALRLGATTVQGGVQNASATVLLTGPAPAGGLTVTLTHTSASTTIPSSVNVAAGQRSASFVVVTKHVAASTTDTITAHLGSAAVQATLTIMP
jgi:hypothetical protein